MQPEDIKARLRTGRKMERADADSLELAPDDSQIDSLGPLAALKGTWSSTEQGWNLIALPFKDPSAPFNYRLLMNQYGENLDFSFVDENIPNRGINPDTNGDFDQLLTGLDYQQVITQVESDDSPSSSLRSANGKGIHHEPGLFPHIMNHQTIEGGKKLQIARLATIPHGDSVLTLGTVDQFDGPPTIPDLDARPIGVVPNINNPYLAPYLHFENSPFLGTVPSTILGFPGFHPTNANSILQFANPGTRVKKNNCAAFRYKIRDRWHHQHPICCQRGQRY